MNNNERKIIGYNPQTGEPIYEEVSSPKIVGYNPQTGEPIYENRQEIPAPVQPVQPKIVGYDPNTGAPIYENQMPVQNQVIGYNTQTGEPIYGQTNAQYNYNAPKKKGSKLWLKILFAIIALALIGGLATGLYFAFRGEEKDTQEEDDNRGGHTINDYDDDDDDDDDYDDDDDDDYDDDDDDDDYDDDDDDDDYDYVDDDDDDDDSSDSFKALGYEFTKVSNYSYKHSEDEVVIYNSTKSFDILLSKDDIDTLANNLSLLEENVASILSNYEVSNAQVKYISGNKCVTIDIYDPSYKEKAILVFTKAPSTDYTFYVLYYTEANTYDYYGFADFFTLIKDIKYVGGYKAKEL